MKHMSRICKDVSAFMAIFTVGLLLTVVTMSAHADATVGNEGSIVSTFAPFLSRQQAIDTNEAGIQTSNTHGVLLKGSAYYLNTTGKFVGTNLHYQGLSAVPVDSPNTTPIPNFMLSAEQTVMHNDAIFSMSMDPSRQPYFVWNYGCDSAFMRKVGNVWDTSSTTYPSSLGAIRDEWFLPPSDRAISFDPSTALASIRDN